MFKKAWILLFFFSITSCFKRSQNHNALIHQRSCIDCIEQEDYARGKLHCELCLEYDSSMPECLNGIGLIALIENDQDKAHSFFTKALRQDNDFSQARNNLGVIYFTNGDFLKAKDYFERSLQIDPSNLDARYNLSLSHLRLAQRLIAKNEMTSSADHLLKAEAQIEKLLAIEPSFAGANRDRGLIALNLHDLSDLPNKRALYLKKSKEAFLACLNQEKDDGCFEGLAQVFLHEGQYTKAFAHYFSCLTYNATNVSCRNGIILAYEKSVQAENGYKDFSQLIKNEPANAFGHQAFCFALFERGLDAEALKQCELALRLKPDLCSAQFRLAEYFTGLLSPKAAKYCQSFLICGQNQDKKEITKCQEILTASKR